MALIYRSALSSENSQTYYIKTLLFNYSNYYMIFSLIAEFPRKQQGVSFFDRYLYVSWLHYLPLWMEELGGSEYLRFKCRFICNWKLQDWMGLHPGYRCNF